MNHEFRCSIELDLHMYLPDGHFLFIHFLSIDTLSQNLVAATTSSQHYSDFTHILIKMTGKRRVYQLDRP
jgi:hypothetical protein